MNKLKNLYEIVRLISVTGVSVFLIVLILSFLSGVRSTYLLLFFIIFVWFLMNYISLNVVTNIARWINRVNKTPYCPFYTITWPESTQTGKERLSVTIAIILMIVMNFIFGYITYRYYS